MLYYLATNKDAKIIFHASDMILKIHSGASHLPAKNANSCALGHLLLSSVLKDGEPITLNGAIFTFRTILKICGIISSRIRIRCNIHECERGTHH